MVQKLSESAARARALELMQSALKDLDDAREGVAAIHLQHAIEVIEQQSDGSRATAPNPDDPAVQKE